MNEQDLKTHFGRAVKAVRKANGLTQEFVAGQSGIATNYISEIERGHKTPGLYRVFTLANGLNIEPFELIRLAQASADGKLIVETNVSISP